MADTQNQTTTSPFDPARYLDTDESRMAYLAEALATGDSAFVIDACRVVMRSVTPALVERARRVFCDALRVRVNMRTPLGDVPVQAVREAMAEAMEAINNDH